MFSDPYFQVQVLPAVEAFREAKSELIALERRYEANPSEETVAEIRFAQSRFEGARLALRQATRATPSRQTS